MRVAGSCRGETGTFGRGECRDEMLRVEVSGEVSFGRMEGASSSVAGGMGFFFLLRGITEILRYWWESLQSAWEWRCSTQIMARLVSQCEVVHRRRIRSKKQ